MSNVKESVIHLLRKRAVFDLILRDQSQTSLPVADQWRNVCVFDCGSVRMCCRSFQFF
jgi:hypothetical protein